MNITLDPSAPATVATAAIASALEGVLAALLPRVLARRGELMALKEWPGGRYLHVNDAMAQLMRRPASEIAGRTDAELLDGALATALRAADQTAGASAETLASEHRFEIDGQRHEFTVLRARVEIQGRAYLCSVWTDLAPERQRESQLRNAIEQIEQQQQANALLRRELADQAMRDPASGLYRRNNFEDQLRREVDMSTREHREFAIVFIEIDPFAAGIVALGPDGVACIHEAVGRLLRGGTRTMDASCRYDERRFAVLLSGVGLATAHSRMEGLRRKCAAQIVVHEGRELAFTVAMGVASFPHTARTQEELVDACEAALAESRRRGGNNVTLAAIPFGGG